MESGQIAKVTIEGGQLKATTVDGKRVAPEEISKRISAHHCAVTPPKAGCQAATPTELTVLRDGTMRGTSAVREISDADLLALIIGRTLEASFPPKHRGGADDALAFGDHPCEREDEQQLAELRRLEGEEAEMDPPRRTSGGVADEQDAGDHEPVSADGEGPERQHADARAGGAHSAS